MKRLLYACSTLSMFAIFCAPVSVAQGRYQEGATDARQHGYEHGYREGFAFGQNSQVSNRDQDIVNQKLRQADTDYQPAFGSRDEFRQGYTDGFRAGMTDARAGNRSRLEDLFRSRDPNYNPDRNSDERVTGIPPQNNWPVKHAADDIAYRDGFDTGFRDRQSGRGFQPHKHQAWRTANHGYDPAFGSQSQYKLAYRRGYETGYREGFGESR
jgi:hypothetical protein